MKPIIIANWKNKPETSEEAVALFDEVAKNVQDVKNVKVVICPPFFYLLALKHLNNSTIKLGLQNTFVKKEEINNEKISWEKAKEQGAAFVIVGHSSRRVFLGETDETISQELKEVLSLGLTPVFCVGETVEQRQAGQTEAVLETQIKNGFAGISAEDISKIIIAYEPIWAISCGDPYSTKEMPTPEDIKQIKDFIKKIVGDAKILYGGSTNAANANIFIEEAGMDGLLVGGASLDAKEFINLVKTVAS